MYPRLAILRISAILTDTDRIRIVISLFERIRIGHGYFATDIIRICITPLFYFFKFYFMYIVYIRPMHNLQVIECRVIDASRQISRDS